MNTDYPSVSDFARAFISRRITLESSAQSPSLPTAPRYDALIQEAGALLKSGLVGTLAHIQRRWSDVVWIKSEEQRVNADVEACRDNSNRITLYPSILEKSSQWGCYSIIREFGRLLYESASKDLQQRWTLKLGLPSSAQLDAVQSKLTPQFQTYRGMVESFRTAMDRTVAIHIANALIDKKVPFSQCHGINIRQWGATQEYANRRRYHVNIPMVSAYSSKEIFEDFGTALADWVCATNGISESSVAEATHFLIQDILGNLR